MFECNPYLTRPLTLRCHRFRFSVTGRLYVYLELTSLEELLDTGGLLIWREDE